jgi:hypothetical protein
MKFQKGKFYNFLLHLQFPQTTLPFTLSNYSHEDKVTFLNMQPQTEQFLKCGFTDQAVHLRRNYR